LSTLACIKRWKCLPVYVLTVILWTALGARYCRAQASDPANSGPAVSLISVRKVADKQGTVIEIQCTVPVTPSIQKLDNPPRLQIEVPCTRNGVQKMSYEATSEIRSISVGQVPNQPSSRIDVELRSPSDYSVERSGDKVVVRVKPLTGSAPAPTGSDASSLEGGTSSLSGLLTNSPLDAGGSITAAATTTVLRLARGGEIHVCPGTTVSLTPSRNKRELMLALSTGSMETHYPLDTSADSILTPDFRILLPGPGEFDYAVSTDARGNTCVRALPGNTASAVVSELIGDRTYQVKPNDQLVFRAGRLDQVDQHVPANCGCPAAAPATLVASAETSPDTSKSAPLALNSASSGQTAPADSTRVTPDDHPGQVTVSVTQTETKPLPPSNPNDVHVTVEAPFVFNASAMPPSVAQQAASLPPMSSARRADLAPVVLPPPPAEAQPVPPQSSSPSSPPQHRGFFGKVRGFFAKLFL
jgi:hypothetical protein